jgi:hypothetical protein
MKDKSVWLDDVRGNYCVKPSYNMLLNSTVSAVPGGGKQWLDAWKWIWKVHAAPKIKHVH